MGLASRLVESRQGADVMQEMLTFLLPIDDVHMSFRNERGAAANRIKQSPQSGPQKRALEMLWTNRWRLLLTTERFGLGGLCDESQIEWCGSLDTIVADDDGRRTDLQWSH